MGFALSDIELRSTAFAAAGAIPSKYTGEGEDVSPALSWSNTPEASQSFAIICHDPDAPLVTAKGNYGFVHWVYYNIAGSASSLEEACTTYTQGRNDFGKQSYGGPMPPNGHGLHHYYFWLLAFDQVLDLAPGLSMQELLAATEGNLIAMNRLVGNYQRD